MILFMVNSCRLDDSFLTVFEPMRKFTVITEYFASHPRMLFAADAVGAAVTAFLLYGVLRNCPDFFAMPPNILCYLSLTAALFSVYSFCCFAIMPVRWSYYLRIISIANVLYCLVTLVLLILYRQHITTWDVAYFLGEIAVIVSLVFVERQTIAKASAMQE